MKKIILSLLLAAGITGLKSQNSEGGEPYSRIYSLGSADISAINVDAAFTQIGLDTIVEVDSLTNETTVTYDPIIGQTFPVTISLRTQGSWEALPNGDSLCRIRINSAVGDYAMALFDRFYLPERTSLFIYSEDYATVLGAYTSSSNKESKQLTTIPILGRSIILEYYKPADLDLSIAEQLHISHIGSLTKDLTEVYKSVGFGGSGDCMVNAKCEEGWCNERRSVALILRVIPFQSQIRWCTGTVIENERRDGKPFFLTAFHCLDNDGTNNVLSAAEKAEVTHWGFIFNYQSPDCSDPSTEPSLAEFVSGADFINAHDNSDYALLCLSSRPNKNFNVFYSGWTNDEDDMTNNGVTIHHPDGDIKKISKYDKKISPLINYWKVDYTSGSTEPGSSGAPLFNSSGLVVGQLKMGLAACGNKKSDYFGCFHRSWHHFGINWNLNPNGTPNSSWISSMSGDDELCRDYWNFTSGNDLHTSANVSYLSGNIGTRMYDGVYNAKYGITAQNNQVQSGTTVLFECGGNITLQAGFTAASGCSFRARIADCPKGCGGRYRGINGDNNNGSEGNMVISTASSQAQKNLLRSANGADESINVYPNPSADRNLVISSEQKGDVTYNVKVFNACQQLMKVAATKRALNLGGLAPGVYYLEIELKGSKTIKKVILL